ncbi:hypothetical protein [Delftia sp. JD2]|uniref:hypothetical protein n=1 Tax=Delftia sp. JD2 TaxID=469553 RepID=UPI0011128050|nr:hypothetical protein [Delftia sp. JD2]
MDEDMESGDCRPVPLEFAADSCFRQPFHGRLCRFIRATGNNLPHKRCTSAAQALHKRCTSAAQAPLNPFPWLAALLGWPRLPS